MREYAKNGGDFLRAINMSVQSIYRIFPYTSLTFLASDGRKGYRVPRCLEKCGGYAIYYATLRHSIVISQEKYFEADWKELPNKGFLSVDRELKTDVVEALPRSTQNVIIAFLKDLLVSSKCFLPPCKTIIPSVPNFSSYSPAGVAQPGQRREAQVFIHLEKRNEIPRPLGVRGFKSHLPHIQFVKDS